MVKLLTNQNISGIIFIIPEIFWLEITESESTVIMKRIFINMGLFERCWQELGLTDDDLMKIQDFLLEKPDRGNIIQNTGGVRKVRWDLSNKGKSGGIRVLYIDYEYYNKIYFLLAFPKSKKENISDKMKLEIKRIAKKISEQLKENQSKIKEDFNE